eukprot:3156600-Prymnesium_polylepis.1
MPRAVARASSRPDARPRMCLRPCLAVRMQSGPKRAFACLPAPNLSPHPVQLPAVRRIAPRADRARPGSREGLVCARLHVGSFGCSAFA